MTTARVRAPELVLSPAVVVSPNDGGWLNTEPSGSPLTLAQLRGRFVLLDFWSFCCGNCLHVIDELRPLERKYEDILTVIGIHSPKFPHERELAAVEAAIERYEVEHPVLSDPQLRLWQQYAVKAWPTLVLIDPEGYVVAQAAGEGQVSALDAVIAQLVPVHRNRGTLREGDRPFVPPAPAATTLRFPAKVIVLPASRTGRDADSLLVADAGHHALVELALDGEAVLRRIGAGVRGRADGPAAAARFAEPSGLALLPAEIADLAGYDVIVADTANHVLRAVRLADGAVVHTLDLPAALAGTRTVTGEVPSVLSPWDVAWWPALNRLVVAAAGVHLLLSVEPFTAATAVLAGTTVEGLRDGPALEGWLAQPSGLAVDGDRLWFVDSETSALRYLTVDQQLHTVVGEGLFDFGHVDGPAAGARLQHPLGVTVLPDASIAVLDTYNGAVRRYDPKAHEVSTLATDLAEPSGAVLVAGPIDAAERADTVDIVVVESAAHRLVRAVPRSEIVAGAPLHMQRPATDVAPGQLVLEVMFEPAPGRKRDERFGPSTLLSVSASPDGLLVDGDGDGTELRRTVRIAADATGGVLHITAQATSCDEDAGVDHPACYLSRQDWGVPIRVVDGATRDIRLVLLA